MIIILILIIAIVICIVVLKVNNKKYKNFVLSHSISIKKIKELNSKYQFKTIKKYELVNSYDNQNFYNEISPRDYLVYQLVYMKKEVQAEIKNTLYNFNNIDFYLDDIKENIKVGKYDTDPLLKNNNKLLRTENKLLNKLILKPTVKFKMDVILYLTNINGNIKTRKNNTFYEEEIENIIFNLGDKTDNYYNNKEIWDSICKVERGKVSNRMRFAIYKRDNYRCQKCGRKSDDLEVDHIFPIAKGGKTTFDNLQTLCQKCNKLKSDTIEIGSFNRDNTRYGICPECGAPLKLKNGQYGKFYGCMNYPKCKYTKRIK